MTTIEWTDESWNPIDAVDRITNALGWMCTHVSPGCLNCYAERINRWRGNGHHYRVPELDKVEIRLLPNVLRRPLSWRKPRRVFVCSMTDLFHDAHPDELIDQVFAVMQASPRHTFQVLTKRADRMSHYIAHAEGRVTAAGEDLAAVMGWCHANEDRPWPLSNVWCGTSVENQRYANERIPQLLQTPAALRFLSCEPLLGSVQIAEYLPNALWNNLPSWKAPALGWVIVGGESGPNARPMDVQWARWIVEQCTLAGVPVFVKQLGAKPGFRLEDEEARGNVMPSFHHYDAAAALYIKKLRDPKGGNMAEWPEELRVRNWPAAPVTT